MSLTEQKFSGEAVAWHARLGDPRSAMWRAVTKRLCSGYRHLDVSLGNAGQVLDCVKRADAPYNYTMPLMRDLRRCQRLIWLYNRLCPTPDRAIKVVKLRSARPGVYGLGGDISEFYTHAKARDRKFFSRYGRLCIDLINSNLNFLSADVLIVAYVDGECYGGGFECALSCHYILAGENARFCFPESLFGLFPGMGAYSILQREISPRHFEELVREGRAFTASDVGELNVPRIRVTKPGEEERFVRNLLKNHDSVVAATKAHNRVAGATITKRELIDIVEIWADAASRLSETRLRMIARLVKAQSRRFDTAGEG